MTSVDGKPAAHRKLWLYGLERWCLQSANDDRAHSYWSFVTDSHGNARVPIGDFAGWLNDEIRPGWGIYALVAEAGPRDAGGVSSRFWFDNAPSHQGQDPRSYDWAPEWGAILPLQAAGMDLPVRLERGFKLSGRVVDDQHPDVPLAGVEIVTNIDLEAETHTGNGGQALFHHVKTNRKGEFIFPRLFPSVTTIALQRPAIWLKSNLNGSWQYEALSTLAPPKSDSVHLLIGATTAPRFRYFGKVTDANGQPVPNMVVEFHVMAQSDWSEATWAEDHTGPQITTKADGTYEFLSLTPWILSIFAGAAIPGLHDSVWHGKTTIPPGEYDLHLHTGSN